MLILKKCIVVECTDPRASTIDLIKDLDSKRFAENRKERLQFLQFFFDCVMNERTMQITSVEKIVDEQKRDMRKVG